MHIRVFDTNRSTLAAENISRRFSDFANINFLHIPFLYVKVKLKS